MWFCFFFRVSRKGLGVFRIMKRPERMGVLLVRTAAAAAAAAVC